MNLGEVSRSSVVAILLLGSFGDFAIDIAGILPRRVIGRWQRAGRSGTRDVSPNNNSKVVFLVLGIEDGIGV